MQSIPAGLVCSAPAPLPINRSIGAEPFLRMLDGVEVAIMIARASGLANENPVASR